MLKKNKQKQNKDRWSTEFWHSSLHHLSVHTALPEVTVWSWHVYAHTHMHRAATAAYGMETSRTALRLWWEICQRHPAEALIMAGQQSVNHYWDAIELNAAWLNHSSQKCKIYPTFVWFIYKVPHMSHVQCRCNNQYAINTLYDRQVNNLQWHPGYNW